MSFADYLEVDSQTDANVIHTHLEVTQHSTELKQGKYNYHKVKPLHRAFIDERAWKDNSLKMSAMPIIRINIYPLQAALDAMFILIM